MIILFEKDEQEFTTLGLGVLSDASTCVVTEELNGSFELEMEYPANGAHYKDLKEERLILAKPNDIMQAQPFRIYKITRPIDGIVTVYATHISYDLSKVPVRAFNIQKFSELCYEEDEHGQVIQNGALKDNQMIDTPFRFKHGADKTEVETSFRTKVPYSYRSLLAGSEDSILDTYTGDYTFDRYDVILSNRRGEDRNFTIRYAKNMTDLEQETSSEVIYSGLCPYYSSTTSETKTALTKKYKEAYISKDASQTIAIEDENGVRIYPPEYISYNEGGSGLGAILTTAVTNIIATEDDDSIKMYNHLIRAKKTMAYQSGSHEPISDKESEYVYDVTYQMAYINKDSVDEFGPTWLCNESGSVIIPTAWDPSMNPYADDAPIYRIYTSGAHLYEVYIWDSSVNKYRVPGSDDNIEIYAPTMPNIGTETEEKDNIILYEGDIIYVGEKRAAINDQGTQYGSDWLYEIIEELVQHSTEDPRWKLSDEPLTPEEGINYKVAEQEKFIQKYYIKGDLSSNKVPNTLYDDEGCTQITVPVDQKGYYIISKEEKTLGNPYNLRWSAYDKQYTNATDTRYIYTNYIWNGTQYQLRDTSTDSILVTDLTDKFEDNPKDSSQFQKKLYDETIKYIKDNKIGELKDTIKVSFIKLSSSPEYSKWKELEKVMLGDTVHVVYEDLGINVTKKVTRTEFNVLKESYDEIELGEKSSNFTNNAVITGDGVSSLTNDRNFADDITVTNLFAKYVEADYMKSFKADFDEAEITTLTSEEITATLIQAERFQIDKLVAGLLIADNAAIRETLTVGEGLVVNGQINVKNGSISIKGSDRIAEAVKAYVNANAEQEYGIDWLKANKTDTDYMVPDPVIIYNVYDVVNNEDVHIGYYQYEPSPSERYIARNLDGDVYFEVDESGNVTANSLTITGGDIQLGPVYKQDPSDPSKQVIDYYNFEVDNDGEVTIRNGSINLGWDSTSSSYKFSVDNNGNFKATSGEIGGCTIDASGKLEVPTANLDGTITANAINLGDGFFTVDKNGNAKMFNCTVQGNINASSGQLTDISLISATSLSADSAVIEDLFVSNTPEFASGAIFIGDCQISTNRGSSSHTVTVTFSVSAEVGSYTEGTDTTSFGIFIEASRTLPQASPKLGYSIQLIINGDTYAYQGTATIPAGQAEVSITKLFPGRITSFRYGSIRSVSPSSKQFTEYTGDPSFEFINSIMPGSNSVTIGDSSDEWSNIYVEKLTLDGHKFGLNAIRINNTNHSLYPVVGDPDENYIIRTGTVSVPQWNTISIDVGFTIETVVISAKAIHEGETTTVLNEYTGDQKDYNWYVYWSGSRFTIQNLVTNAAIEFSYIAICEVNNT